MYFLRNLCELTADFCATGCSESFSVGKTRYVYWELLHKYRTLRFSALMKDDLSFKLKVFLPYWRLNKKFLGKQIGQYYLGR